MAKQKNPLFSLGAKGTIADTLTHQRRLGEAIIRTKPTPTDPKTLPQIYQRWLYEDYLYLWSQQTEAERLIWRQEAAKTHNTQLGAFMKDRLANLPDIVGMWRLDERTGIVARDSSRNALHGVIHGALHTPGVIDYALDFDGSDDYVALGDSPTLNFTAPPFTLVAKCSLEPLLIGTTGMILGSNLNGGYSFGWYRITQQIWLSKVGISWIRSTDPIDVGQLHDFGCSFDSSNNAHFYINGVPDSGNPHAYVETFTPGLDYNIGLRPTGNLSPWRGFLDNVILYNRSLDASEHLRWAERSYP